MTAYCISIMCLSGATQEDVYFQSDTLLMCKELIFCLCYCF